MKHIVALVISIVFLLPQVTQAQDCLAPILAVGDTGQVLGEVANNVRAEPSTSGEIVGAIAGGSTFTVSELGECDGGIRWVQVQASNGITGWTAESLSDEAFVTRVAVLDSEFEPLGNGNISINSDGTVLAIGHLLYDVGTFERYSDERLPGLGDSLFSPTDPHLIFRYLEDFHFTLVDIRDMRVLWSAEYDPPSGIGGGIFAGEAYFTFDGRYLIFSSTEPESSWQVLDMETLEFSNSPRSYYGEAVALIPNTTNMVRFIASISGYETPPPFGVDDMVTDNATGISGQAVRPMGFRGMIYLPDGNLLTVDIDGVFDVFNADLTHNRTLDLPAGVVSTWDVNENYVAIGIRPDNDTGQDGYLMILSATSLELVTQIPLRMEDDSPARIHDLEWHSSGALGLKVGTVFRWLTVDELTNGTLTEMIVPIF